MKYDNNDDIAHDKINTGDKIWYLTDVNKFLAIVIEVRNSDYTIAYYDNLWTITITDYEKIFPRTRDEKLSNIFEIYDTVLINTKYSKTFGVVIGYEMGLHVILKYADKIWRRVILPASVLEHHEKNYDAILFENRRSLLSKETWIRWQLPVM